MTRERGLCDECGRRTAVTYAHANLCEWCWPASGQPASIAATGTPRRTEAKPVCRDCGAELSGARRGQCLDCEVNHAFDRLGQQIQAQRLARHPHS